MPRKQVPLCILASSVAMLLAVVWVALVSNEVLNTHPLAKATVSPPACAAPAGQYPPRRTIYDGSFVPIETHQVTSSPYRVMKYLVSIGGPSPPVVGVLSSCEIVVFVPGNGGSFYQATGLLRAMLEQAPDGRCIEPLSMDLRQEVNIGSGLLMRAQAQFVADSVRNIMLRYNATNVTLVGNSMGGVVVRTAMMLSLRKAFRTVSQHKIRVVLVSSPVQYPPILLNNDVLLLYLDLYREEFGAHGDNETDYVSFTSGEGDAIIRPDASNMLPRVLSADCWLQHPAVFLETVVQRNAIFGHNAIMKCDLFLFWVAWGVWHGTLHGQAAATAAIGLPTNITTIKTNITTTTNETTLRFIPAAANINESGVVCVAQQPLGTSKVESFFVDIDHACIMMPDPTNSSSSGGGGMKGGDKVVLFLVLGLSSNAAVDYASVSDEDHNSKAMHCTTTSFELPFLPAIDNAEEPNEMRSVLECVLTMNHTTTGTVFLITLKNTTASIVSAVTRSVLMHSTFTRRPSSTITAVTGDDPFAVELVVDGGEIISVLIMNRTIAASRAQTQQQQDEPSPLLTVRCFEETNDEVPYERCEYRSVFRLPLPLSTQYAIPLRFATSAELRCLVRLYHSGRSDLQLSVSAGGYSSRGAAATSEDSNRALIENIPLVSTLGEYLLNRGRMGVLFVIQSCWIIVGISLVTAKQYNNHKVKHTTSEKSLLLPALLHFGYFRLPHVDVFARTLVSIVLTTSELGFLISSYIQRAIWLDASTAQELDTILTVLDVPHMPASWVHDVAAALVASGLSLLLLCVIWTSVALLHTCCDTLIATLFIGCRQRTAKKLESSNTTRKTSLMMRLWVFPLLLPPLITSIVAMVASLRLRMDTSLVMLAAVMVSMMSFVIASLAAFAVSSRHHQSTMTSQQRCRVAERSCGLLFTCTGLIVTILFGSRCAFTLFNLLSSGATNDLPTSEAIANHPPWKEVIPLVLVFTIGISGTATIAVLLNYYEHERRCEADSLNSRNRVSGEREPTVVLPPSLQTGTVPPPLPAADGGTINLLDGGFVIASSSVGGGEGHTFVTSSSDTTPAATTPPPSTPSTPLLSVTSGLGTAAVAGGGGVRVINVDEDATEMINVRHHLDQGGGGGEAATLPPTALPTTLPIAPASSSPRAMLLRALRSLTHFALSTSAVGECLVLYLGLFGVRSIYRTLYAICILAAWSTVVSIVMLWKQQQR